MLKIIWNSIMMIVLILLLFEVTINFLDVIDAEKARKSVVNFFEKILTPLIFTFIWLSAVGLIAALLQILNIYNFD